jgi:hypothetical protein
MPCYPPHVLFSQLRIIESLLLLNLSLLLLCSAALIDLWLILQCALFRLHDSEKATDHVIQLILLKDGIDDNLLNVCAAVAEEEEEKVRRIPQFLHLVAKNLQAAEFVPLGPIFPLLLFFFLICELVFILVLRVPAFRITVILIVVCGWGQGFFRLWRD